MSFVKSILGFLFFIVIVLARGSLYRGSQSFYRIAQGNGPFKRLTTWLLDGPIAAVCADYKFLKANIDNQRLSDRVVEQYSTDSLLGYGDEHFDKGGATLQEQQRGLILPMLEKALQGSPQTVVELGTGNGDVVAYLAAKFPKHTFIGIDFSVATAIRKHSAPNLRFIKGYALDLLEDGLTGDVVFASSTFVVFTPKELATYFKLFKGRGFSRVLLNEPCWGGYQQTQGAAESAHLEGAVWYHNYAGYLKAAGYTISGFEFFRYKHPRSPRPDLYVALVEAVS